MPFSATVASPMKGAERISRNLGIYAGKVVIASYTANAVLTAITKYFVPTSNATAGGFVHGICSVQIDGPSDQGYIMRWDYTTGCFRAYYPSVATTPTGTWSMKSGTASGLTAVYYSSASGINASAVAGVVAITCTALIAAPGSECAADVAVGTFGFVAVGFIR